MYHAIVCVTTKAVRVKDHGELTRVLIRVAEEVSGKDYRESSTSWVLGNVFLEEQLAT